MGESKQAHCLQSKVSQRRVGLRGTPAAASPHPKGQKVSGGQDAPSETPWEPPELCSLLCPSQQKREVLLSLSSPAECVKCDIQERLVSPTLLSASWGNGAPRADDATSHFWTAAGQGLAPRRLRVVRYLASGSKWWGNWAFGLCVGSKWLSCQAGGRKAQLWPSEKVGRSLGRVRVGPPPNSCL